MGYFDLGFSDAQFQNLHSKQSPREFLDLHSQIQRNDWEMENLGEISSGEGDDAACSPDVRNRKPRILGGLLLLLILCALGALVYIYWHEAVLFESTQPQLPPDTRLDSAESPLWIFVAIAVFALLVGVMSSLVYYLRQKDNKLYWQIACWLLMVVGILIRPIVEAALAGHEPIQTTLKGAVVAGVVALGVFPGMMGILNKLNPEPGLTHVALPFSLGLFMDVAKVMAATYVPSLAWLA